MKAKIFLAIFLCLVSVSPSFSHVNPDEESKGNKGTITGRIVDESNLPLPGASIYIGKPENGAVSDVNGFYRLVNIEEGQHRLSVSYIGFKPLVRGIDVKAGSTLTIDIQMKAGLDIQEVVINGSLQGQSKALNQQKNSINVTNMISSDQIGRFPDANIGDALKRIPGINVQYDQGEARFGHIRGTAPEYNSVTIDGNRIPSAEPEIRSVQLDLIPSDMVQTIEVNKVVTADMDADAIGGSVNLVTKSNPYKRRIAGTVGGTYNFLSEKPAENISLLYADRFFNDRLGLTLAGTYQNHKLGSDNIEAEWDEGDAGMIMKEFQVRTYLIQRLRQSYSAAIDYTFSPSHKLDAKVMFNHRNDWENRFAAGYNDLDEPGESKVERQLKGGTGKDARLEDQRTLFLSLKGQHHFGLLDVKWNGTYAKASQDRPNERYLQYVYEDVEIDQDLSDTKKPKVIVSNPEARDFNSSWEWDELTEEQGYTEDIDKVFGIDFSLPLSRDHNKSVLKFGGKYRSKEKNQDIEFTDYEPVDEDNFNSQAFAQTVNMTKSNFLAGDYAVGTFFRKEFLGNLDLRNSAQFSGEENPEEEAASFDAREKVLSGYLRYDQKLGDLTLVAGLRTENTDLEYSGYTLSLDEEGGRRPGKY
jgi:TonB-dependent receptor